MYVIMQPEPFNTATHPSGYGPTDHVTYVMASALSATETELAKLIAHEEVHQRGHDSDSHNTRLSYDAQQSCP